MKTTLILNISHFPVYVMISDWSIYEKFICLYCIKNNKAFTLINDDKASFFGCYRRFLLSHYRYRNNKNDFLECKFERDVTPLILLGEELYDMVSHYKDIVFDFHSGK